MKTTNAKAKALQTPAPAHADNDLGKTNQRSVSARKPKPRVSHAEMTKLEVLGDKDELEEREIEYMPPRGKGDVIRTEGLSNADNPQISPTYQTTIMKSTFQCSRTVA